MPLKPLKPNDMATDWTGHTFAERIHMCRLMLLMHGFLSPGESEKVKQRQIKKGVVPQDNRDDDQTIKVPELPETYTHAR
jgi:hypothetical protein